MIPLCVLTEKEDEVSLEEEWEHVEGVITSMSWELKGKPVWGPQCEVCGVVLKDDEVDLCGRCEEEYYE